MSPRGEVKKEREGVHPRGKCMGGTGRGEEESEKQTSANLKNME